MVKAVAQKPTPTPAPLFTSQRVDPVSHLMDYTGKHESRESVANQGNY
jgi:hypothetical protein